MTGPSARPRIGGHELRAETDVLRFDVADVNRIIQKAVADSELYREIQNAAGHPDDWQVLALTCFAITNEWTPARLAEGTGFRLYRLARAATLEAGGFGLWPTEVFVDDQPDPRNSVHYDLVVAAGPSVIPAALIGGAPSARRAARAALAPIFQRVLDLLGDPLEIPPAPSDSEPGTMGPERGGAPR